MAVADFVYAMSATCVEVEREGAQMGVLLSLEEAIQADRSRICGLLRITGLSPEVSPDEIMTVGELRNAAGPNRERYIQGGTKSERKELDAEIGRWLNDTAPIWRWNKRFGKVQDGRRYFRISRNGGNAPIRSFGVKSIAPVSY